MEDELSSLKQRVEELEDLNRLSQTLGSTLNVQETLNAILASCLKLCRAQHAVILLFSPQSKELVQTLVRSSDPSQDAIEHRLNVFVAGWIERNQKPLLTEDVLKEVELTNPSRRTMMLGPALAVPLTFEGKRIGIINLVNSRGGAKFSQGTLRVAGIIAGLAAQFIHRANLHERLFEDNLRLKGELKKQYEIESMLGSSPAIQQIKEKISIVAPTTAAVLLVGETGTGKELVARAIHAHSQRADKPFIPINCSAIPAALVESELFGHERGAFTGAAAMQKGKFELADKGTVFLDEIAEMPLDLQPKLLRVLEERRFFRVGSSLELQVDVRVIAASSRDLQQASKESKFRDDLFHRLNVVPIHLPPLRERKQDIPILAQAFIREFSNGAKQFTPDALESLSGLEWRGNVRELRNVVERISIFVSSKEITGTDVRTLGIKEGTALSTLMASLQELLRTSAPNSDLPGLVEEKLVRLAMGEAKGNVSDAARLLGIDRSTLRRRIRKYGK